MPIIDSKSDLGFKKVFGEKPHLLISLLNNFLPLTNPIISVQYISPEVLPDLHEGKNSIVDVRCTDSQGRHFIVEMQVEKQGAFTKRVIMNTTKVYSRQLSKEQSIEMTQPVYSLNLLNHKMKPDETVWYHHYLLTNLHLKNDHLDELHIILIELPKWKKLSKFDLDKPQDRWLMYFSDPNMFSILSKEERARFNEISEAIEVLETTNYTPEQLRGYELYLDNIRTYVASISEARNEGREEGRLEGLNQGKSLMMSNTLEIIKALKEKKLTPAEIGLKFNVDEDFVIGLQRSL